MHHNADVAAGVVEKILGILVANIPGVVAAYFGDDVPSVKSTIHGRTEGHLSTKSPSPVTFRQLHIYTQIPHTYSGYD